MCGIVGYIGSQNCVPIILEGLKRLEYRGYDSAGISFVKENVCETLKKEGKVSVLEEMVDQEQPESDIGIGHTRWATHGIPNEINAHPHFNSKRTISLVHNGIIENYSWKRVYGERMVVCQ